jgi:TRAP-type C4-dicarboxylate transport system permease large subunit
LVIREVMPFLWVLITVLFLITYVPGLVLFLPRLVGFQS